MQFLFFTIFSHSLHSFRFGSLSQLFALPYVRSPASVRPSTSTCSSLAQPLEGLLLPCKNTYIMRFPPLGNKVGCQCNFRNSLLLLLLLLPLLLLLLCTPTTTTLLLAVLIRMIGAIAKGNKSKKFINSNKADGSSCKCKCELTWNLIGFDLVRGLSLHYEGIGTFHSMARSIHRYPNELWNMPHIRCLLISSHIRCAMLSLVGCLKERGRKVQRGAAVNNLW